LRFSSASEAIVRGRISAKKPVQGDGLLQQQNNPRSRPD
jgi:hypothetical protein